MALGTHRIGKRGPGALGPGWIPGPGLSRLSNRSTHRPALALGPGGVLHVSGRVPGGWGGRTRLGSPTGKTRFSRSRRRLGGNRLVAPPSGPPGPLPPAQPRRTNAGPQLGSPGVTPPTPVAPPRSHLGSASGPGALTPRSFNGGGETKKGEGATQEGPRCQETDPASGSGREQPRRSCFFPLPPRHLGQPCKPQCSGDPRRRLEPRTAALRVKARGHASRRPQARPPRVGRERRASGPRVGPSTRPNHSTSVGRSLQMGRSG